MNRVIISSSNKGKIKEIKNILSKFDVDIISKDDIGYGSFDVIEDGTTLEMNAEKKAIELWKLTGGIVIADDTGLFVEALNGKPGVYSARYAGDNSTYEDNNNLLLEKMKDMEGSKRKAYFKTVIVVIDDKGKSHIAEGICNGEIAYELSGENGFGYDPLFVPEGFERTFAEMNDEEKNTVSHRGKAVRNLVNIFGKILR
jgi:XTP/dITP diphosphohydrolase